MRPQQSYPVRLIITFAWQLLVWYDHFCALSPLGYAIRSEMASSDALDERAQVGFAKSAAYDQYRPTYSPTIVQLLLEKLNVAGKNGAKILDLAAGTGKFTEALARRDENFQIVAVEPHDGMRQVLDDKKLSGVITKSGKADGIPLKDESVDAVICAQVGWRGLLFSVHCISTRSYPTMDSS